MKNTPFSRQDHPMKKIETATGISQFVWGIIIVCSLFFFSAQAAVNPEVVWVRFGPDSQNDTVVQGKNISISAKFKSATIAKMFWCQFYIRGPYPGTNNLALFDFKQNDGQQNTLEVNWNTKDAVSGDYHGRINTSSDMLGNYHLYASATTTDKATVIGFTNCTSSTQGSLVLNHPNAKFAVQGTINVDTWPSDANPQWQRQKRGGQWEAVTLTDIINSGNLSKGKDRPTDPEYYRYKCKITTESTIWTEMPNTDMLAIKVDLPTTPVNVPYALLTAANGNSVPTSATIAPSDAANKVHFDIELNTLATVLPETASSSPQTLTVTGIRGASGTSKLRAKVPDSLDGDQIATTDEVNVFKIDINSIDANFAPSVENLDVKYTIVPSNYTANSAKLEVFKKEDTVTPIYTDTTIPKNGTNIAYTWNGKNTAGEWIGPGDSEYTVKITVGESSTYQYSTSASNTSTVVIHSIEINRSADEKLYMNDPATKTIMISTVKIKNKLGAPVVTAIPMKTQWSFTPGANTAKSDSYSYATGKFLGKGGDATEIFWETHASSTASSDDGFKLTAKSDTSVSGSGQGSATICFLSSGVGGDKFTLKAIVKHTDGSELMAVNSGLLTVWRKVTFDKIYEMDGETHVSANATKVKIQPYFDDSYVEYEVGPVNAIPADKSVKYIGLWKNTAP